MPVKGQVPTKSREGATQVKWEGVGVSGKRCEDAHPGPLLGVATSRGTDKSKLGVQRPHAGLSGTEELGRKSRRPGQAASGGAPADAILKAKMAAPSKPVPRS